MNLKDILICSMFSGGGSSPTPPGPTEQPSIELEQSEYTFSLSGSDQPQAILIYHEAGGFWFDGNLSAAQVNDESVCTVRIGGQDYDQIYINPVGEGQTTLIAYATAENDGGDQIQCTATATITITA